MCEQLQFTSTAHLVKYTITYAAFLKLEKKKNVD